MRYSMVIDLKACIGCYNCQISCKAENATPPGVLWARVLKAEFGTYPNVRKLSLPLLCMHCNNPPCQKVCPTGAITKRENGIVFTDESKCVGCRYCMMACPYQARYFHDGYGGNLPTFLRVAQTIVGRLVTNFDRYPTLRKLLLYPLLRLVSLVGPNGSGYFPGKGLTPYEEVGYQRHTPGVVTNCNFCVDRVAEGMEPSCVATCMTRCRHFGDLDDSESQVSRLIRDRGGYQLHPELGTDPSVYYLSPW